MQTEVGESTETVTPARGITLAQLWAFAAVFLPVIAAVEASLSTVDLAYHLRAGDLILQTHALPRVDSFTFTAAGLPWLDQQWGAQILFELVHRAGGFEGLVFLRAGLVGAMFLFVYLGCRAAGAWTKRAAWLTLAGFGLSLGGLALRAQLLGMVLFAATAWVVASRRRRPGLLWLVPLIVALWANVHGSFFLGPLIVGLAWLEDRTASNPDAQRLLVIAAVSAAAATVNPFGLRVWSYAVGISTNSMITRQIQEWQPPTIREGLGGFFFLSIGLVAVVLARRRHPTPWPTLLTLGIFATIGLFAGRGTFWWSLYVPIVMSGVLADSPPKKLKPERPAAINTAFVVVMIGLAVLVNPYFRPLTDPGTPPPLLNRAPVELTAALDRSTSPGDRVFNAQIWGSWLEFALPDNPVTVDARIEIFPSRVWEEYFSVSIGREGWQAILDRWNVKAVIAEEEQQRNLIPRIRRDPGWREVARNSEGAVFVRVPGG